MGSAATPLRECVLCRTPLTEESRAAMGLRDFGWINSELPGNVGLMDIDGVLNQYATGRILMLSMMAPHYRVSTGERLTYTLFVRDKGVDVWYLWEHTNGRVKRGVCNAMGRSGPVKEFTRKQLARLVVEWWNAGLADAG